MIKKIDIIILNYNGSTLLKECLPSVVAAADRSSHECCVSIVDNGSTDGSRLYVEKQFPRVLFYRARENAFLVSYNEFIQKQIWQ